jgi:hypothetical protein
MTMAQNQYEVNNKIKHHAHAAHKDAKSGRLERHSGVETDFPSIPFASADASFVIFKC